MIRFDLRAPAGGPASTGELYSAALDMARWADERDFLAVTLSEHHGVDDGYLPAPLVMAGAIAARTERIPISIAALIVPLHDPIRLAEDIAVVDLISRGRVVIVAGLGYRPSEYEAFGVSWERRGQVFDEKLEAMLAGWRGEPVSYDGRTALVTPQPWTRPHPALFVGGSTKVAARRAARFDLGFFPAVADPALVATYEEECEAHGRRPGMVMQPPEELSSVFVTEDPDALWAEIGDQLLHDTMTYHQWQRPEQRSVVDSDATTVDELRDQGLFKLLTPEECVEHGRAAGGVSHHPLCGGVSPEVGWRSLELYESEVLPQLVP